MKHELVSVREDLPKLFNSLGYKIGAEVGVQKGKFSLTLCKGIPGLKLYCVDPWKKYDKVPKQSTQDAYFAEAQKRLDGYDVKFIRKWSMIGVHDFKDKSLDFVYIDGNHRFDYIMEDIIGWGRKVRSGGCIAGHDYFEFKSQLGGVIPAVDTYTKVNHIDPVYFTSLDREVSFFFFKP